MKSPRVRFGAAVVGSAILALLFVPAVGAHVHEHVGPYDVEIGWKVEPAYVDQPNAVFLSIHDAQDQPVTDLGADDITVVVSTADQQSQPLPFEPAWDPEEGEGPLGEYNAAVVPTALGDYTFHLTGTVKGEAVDLTLTSSATTFDTVLGTSDAEFPVKLPTMAEVVTRLDRVDARVTELQAGGGPSQAAVDAAQAAATDARAAADRALLVGAGLGVLGTVLAVAALAAVMRRGRPTAA
ncbi:MAG TPA: hypothetical protein VEX41_11025 [Candidatus Eisenbacteria bacterium]|nr:hypothetical protein [Candidatus Eisenbacteria bacterium]